MGFNSGFKGLTERIQGHRNYTGKKGRSPMDILPTFMKHSATGFITLLGHFQRVWESHIRTRIWKSGWRRFVENARTH